MIITKPKKNQLLLEDDRLSEFNLEVKSKTGLNETEYDDMYNAMVFGYRQPGMDASKQLFMGDRVSVLTLLSSMMENLMRYKVIDSEDLKEMIKLCEENIRRLG